MVGGIFMPFTINGFFSNIKFFMNMGTSTKYAPKLKKINHYRIMRTRDSSMFQGCIRSSSLGGLIQSIVHKL
jgi:hypothetical protein